MKFIFTEISPYLFERMRNGTHYHLMEQLQLRLLTYTSENAELKAYSDAFDQALAAECELVFVSRKSDFTDDINMADRMRDGLFSRFKHFVLGSAALPGLPEYEASMRLKKVVSASNYQSRWRLGQKSGVLAKFFAAMDTAEMKADIETLHLTQTMTQLKEQNNLVLTNLIERGNEASALKSEAMKKARRATEAAYTDLTNHIEAMCNFLKDEKLQLIIESYNVEIKRSTVEATYHYNAKDKAPAVQDPNAQAPDQQQNGATNVKPEQTPQANAPTPQTDGQVSQPNGQVNQPNGQVNQPTGQTGGQQVPPTGQGDQQVPPTGNTPTDPQTQSPSGGSTQRPNDGGSQPSVNEEQKPSIQGSGDSSSGIITEAVPV